jgi:hypothetical protein
MKHREVELGTSEAAVRALAISGGLVLGAAFVAAAYLLDANVLHGISAPGWHGLRTPLPVLMAWAWTPALFATLAVVTAARGANRVMAWARASVVVLLAAIPITVAPFLREGPHLVVLLLDFSPPGIVDVEQTSTALGFLAVAGLLKSALFAACTLLAARHLRALGQRGLHTDSGTATTRTTHIVLAAVGGLLALPLGRLVFGLASAPSRGTLSGLLQIATFASILAGATLVPLFFSLRAHRLLAARASLLAEARSGEGSFRWVLLSPDRAPPDLPMIGRGDRPTHLLVRVNVDAESLYRASRPQEEVALVSDNTPPPAGSAV